MSATNKYATFASVPTGPPTKWTAVTPSDSSDFASAARGLYVGGTGDVVAVNFDDTTATFKAVPVGFIIPGLFRRVNSTSTTATFILAALDIA